MTAPSRPTLMALCAVGGAVLGFLFVWLQRPEAPACTTMGDGTRLCEPLMVIPPPLWAYGAFGAAGAVIGALLGWMVASLRRRSTS